MIFSWTTDVNLFFEFTLKEFKGFTFARLFCGAPKSVLIIGAPPDSANLRRFCILPESARV
jgi:hypothetical protein